MGITTEVAVIGGGATGCGIARDLALRNIDVVLVERKSLNAGTTGRSHCVLHSGARYAETDPQGAINCFQENQIIRQIAPHCIDQTGGYFIQLQQDSTSYFHEKLSACKDINIEAHAIDPDTMSFSNALSNSISSVFAVPDGVIYPAHLIAATAVSAKQAGTRILTNAPVTDLQRDHHQITGVEVAHQIDTITADVVINAAGAWAPSITEMANISLAMSPTRGVMVTMNFNELPAVLNRCRPPDDGDIIVPKNDSIILGTTSEPVTDPDNFQTEDTEITQVMQECAEMLPIVSQLDPVNVYWGVRPLPDTDGSGRQISRDFTIIDHADRDDIGGFLTIVGGKLTTHRLMAEKISDLVANRFDMTQESSTATTPLPFQSQPEKLSSAVSNFGTESPASFWNN